MLRLRRAVERVMMIASSPSSSPSEADSQVRSDNGTSSGCTDDGVTRDERKLCAINNDFGSIQKCLPSLFK